MIEEQAIVIAIATSQIDNGDLVTLEIMRQAPCGICGKTRGCGNALWGKIFSHQAGTFNARNDINANVGDNVIVGIDDQIVLKGALLLYGTPLAALIMGALLSTFIFAKSTSQADLYAVIGAFIGLVLGLFLVKSYISNVRYNSQIQPVILRFANQDSNKTNSLFE